MCVRADVCVWVRVCGWVLPRVSAGPACAGTPTTTQIFSGSAIGFYAIRPIATGEEITISYVELAATRQERRRALLSHYFFDIDDPEATTDPDCSETSSVDACTGTASAAMKSDTDDHLRNGTTSDVSVVGQLLYRTALQVSWRMDPADVCLCALSWSSIAQDFGDSRSNLSADEGESDRSSGVEVLPASTKIDGLATQVDTVGALGTEQMSMLEQLLGSGLGGEKLWEQPIGDDSSNGIAPSPDDDAESEFALGMESGIEGLGVHPLASGTLRPRHSASAIDQLPDDYGQPTATAAAKAGTGHDSSSKYEFQPEVRIWGSGSAAAALREGGDAVAQLLYEMAVAGWKHTGDTGSISTSNGSGKGTAVGNAQKATDMVPLQHLLARCDDLLGTGLSAKRRLMLGPTHVLRLRLQSALMHTAIASGEWRVATNTAEALTPAYNALYPAHSPMLGLHWAAVAKLLQYTGDRPQEALVAAERALEILGPTHRAASAAMIDVGGSRVSHVLTQLEQVRAESALELAQMQQAARQAQLPA